MSDIMYETVNERPMIHATLCFVLRAGSPSHILLGRKKRGFGVGKLNGIGGKLTAEELPEDGVIREVLEEVGLTIPKHALRRAGQITFRFPCRPEFDHFVHVFLASEWEGDPVESGEMAPDWYPVHEIPFDRMWQDDAYWLPVVLNGKVIEAAFTFGEDNETVVSWCIRGGSSTRLCDPQTRSPLPGKDEDRHRRRPDRM